MVVVALFFCLVLEGSSRTHKYIHAIHMYVNTYSLTPSFNSDLFYLPKYLIFSKLIFVFQSRGREAEG